MRRSLFCDDKFYCEVQQAIEHSLNTSGLAILPPLDVMESLAIMKRLAIKPTTTILDPWYNKGYGGVRSDYSQHIIAMLERAGEISQHVFLWGFPEIIATFVEKIPAPLSLVCWLTWYYKNNPSVIRGWRSSQNACLHLSQPGAKLYPEHFLNEVQKDKQAKGKLRYIPGPTSVIEASLLVGFVGRKEQTGHPSQKPVPVFERIILMTTKEADLVFDPMAGSATTGQATKSNNRRAILCDSSEEYIRIAEKRLGISRISIDPVHLASTKAKGA